MTSGSNVWVAYIRWSPRKCLGDSLLSQFVRKIHRALPKSSRLQVMKESQMMNIITSIFELFFLHSWSDRLEVEGDTFYIGAANQKQNSKLKADGGLVFRESKQPLLVIEAKRCSHQESKQDFQKLVGLMTTINDIHNNNVIGILIVGDLIIVYILVKASGYRCIVESSRCYFPVSRDDFSRLSKLYLTLTKTAKLVEHLLKN